MSRAIDVASHASSRASARVKRSSRACAARATPRARRRDALAATLAGLGLIGVSSPSSSQAEGQPIDWLLKTTFDEDVDLVEIIKASASAEAKKRAEAASRGDGGTTEEPEEEREPMDVAATATKFGKLGAILVFADVVTAAIMGKSVLGVAKSMERELEMGEDGEVREVKKTAEPAEGGDWKERMADKLMNKLKEKNAEEVEGEDGDSSA